MTAAPPPAVYFDLTRREWLRLPLEIKRSEAGVRYVVTTGGVQVAVRFVKAKNSQLTQAREAQK